MDKVLNVVLAHPDEKFKSLLADALSCILLPTQYEIRQVDMPRLDAGQSKTSPPRYDRMKSPAHHCARMLFNTNPDAHLILCIGNDRMDGKVRFDECVFPDATNAVYVALFEPLSFSRPFTTGKNLRCYEAIFSLPFAENDPQPEQWLRMYRTVISSLVRVWFGNLDKKKMHLLLDKIV